MELNDQIHHQVPLYYFWMGRVDKRSLNSVLLRKTGVLVCMCVCVCVWWEVLALPLYTVEPQQC